MELIFKEIDPDKIIIEQNKEILDIHKDISDLAEISKILNNNISSQFDNINLLEQSSNISNKQIELTEQHLLDTKIIKENKPNSNNFFIVLMLAGLAIGMPIGFVITTTATGALIGLSTGGILGSSIGYVIETIKK